MTEYKPISSLAKLLQACFWEVGTIAPMAFAKIDVMEAMRQADRVAEIEKFDGCDGCSTGDCPHANLSECVAAQGKIIAQQAAQLATTRNSAQSDTSNG